MVACGGGGVWYPEPIILSITKMTNKTSLQQANTKSISCKNPTPIVGFGEGEMRANLTCYPWDRETRETRLIGYIFWKISKKMTGNSWTSHLLLPSVLKCNLVAKHGRSVSCALFLPFSNQTRPKCIFLTRQEKV